MHSRLGLQRFQHQPAPFPDPAVPTRPCPPPTHVTDSTVILAETTATDQLIVSKLRKPHVYEADVIVDGLVQCPEVLEKCPVLSALLAQDAQRRTEGASRRDRV